MDYKACLNNIIGITRSECECITSIVESESQGAEWYKESTSGEYLDELEGIIPLFGVDAAKDCDNEELAKFFVNARKNAISQLSKDYMIGLAQKFTEGYRPYSGWIANRVFAGTQQLGGATWSGIKLSTIPLKGGLITISKVFTMMDAAAEFNLYVYRVEHNSQHYELIETINGLESLAGVIKENELEAPLELPLSEFGCDYYFFYQPIGFSPKENTVSCNCGHKESILRSYMQITGVYGNDIPMMPYFWSSGYAMGLSFEANVGCNSESVTCAIYDQRADFRAAMAYAVRYKAGELVHEYVLRSNNVNSYTMSSREAMYGKRNHFKSEYVAIINWLVDNTNIDVIDCYVCNDKRVTKGGILA